MTTSPANTTPVLSQEAADAAIQATDLGSMVEDYEFDAARNYHLYFLSDGSVMAVYLVEGKITFVELDPSEGTDPTTPVAEAAAPVLSDDAEELLFNEAVKVVNASEYATLVFNSATDVETGDVVFFLTDGRMIAVDVNGVLLDPPDDDPIDTMYGFPCGSGR